MSIEDLEKPLSCVAYGPEEFYELLVIAGLQRVVMQLFLLLLQGQALYVMTSQQYAQVKHLLN